MTDGIASRPRWADPLIALSLVAFIVAWRIALHAPNLAPVAAASLFAGFALRSRWLALSVAPLGMLLSDLRLGFYEPGIVATVYLCLLAPVALRGVLRSAGSGKAWAARIGLGAVGASLLFFVATNLAVWAWSGWYARTAEGLALCYTAALPFLKYTLAGDALFSALFFGAYALATRRAAAVGPVTRAA